MLVNLYVGGISVISSLLYPPVAFSWDLLHLEKRYHLLTYRGLTWARNYGEMYTYRGSASYITGAHSMKVGARLQSTKAGFRSYYNNERMHYNFASGVPTQLTMFADHAADNPFENTFTQFFAQDQWTTGRLTLQGGLRYEYVTSFFPEGENGYEAHQFGPGFQFPKTEGVRGYHDITPRMGGAYDLFGNGKTALKVSMSKYLQAAYAGEAYTVANPAVSLVQTTTRGWNDRDAVPGGIPNDFVPQCDFLNPAQNLECQGWSTLSWGRQGTTTTVNPETQEGWGKRNWDWQFSAGVQHEIAPRPWTLRTAGGGGATSSSPTTAR